MNNKNNHAVYTASPVSDYQGNPFIEALPVIFEAKDTIQAIKGTIELENFEGECLLIVTAENPGDPEGYLRPKSKN